MDKNERDLRNLHVCLKAMGVAKCVDPYVRELRGAGELCPTGLLKQAGTKLRETKRVMARSPVEHPADAIEVDAGYIATTAAVRWIWLAEPLSDEESRFVAELAEKALAEVSR